LLVAVYLFVGTLHQAMDDSDIMSGRGGASIAATTTDMGGTLSKSLLNNVRHCPGCFSQLLPSSFEASGIITPAKTITIVAAIYGLEGLLANVEPRPPKAAV
jgi:hypothetical protein